MEKIAFIFLAPQVDPQVHRAEVNTPNVQVTLVGVNNYAEAALVAVEIAEQGFSAIELCAGFGYEGVARVKQATNGKCAVGVARFDYHPSLNFKSGDSFFNDQDWLKS